MKEHKPRQFNRYKLNTVARVRKMGAENWSDVRVDSISPMGASFEDTSLLSATDTVEFFMPKPNAKPYHLSAKVIWVKEGLVGVEFTGAMS